MAQTTAVKASGSTIGNKGFQEASVTEGGRNPRIVALESVQSGDSPGGSGIQTHLEASITGSGAASYGTLSGALTAQVRNQSEAINTYTPDAGGFLKLSFFDSGVVTSATLAPGTPVTLSFTALLASSYFRSGVPTSHNNYALSDFDARVTDTTTKIFNNAFLYNRTSSPIPSTEFVFTPDTAVGRTVSLTGEINLGVDAYIEGQPDGGGDKTATSAAEASHTAYLCFQPSSDISLVTASGHDYGKPAAAPVPEAATTLSFGLLLFLGLGSLAARKKARRAAGITTAPPPLKSAPGIK